MAPGVPAPSTLGTTTAGNASISLPFTLVWDGGSPITGCTGDVHFVERWGGRFRARRSSPIVVTGLTNGRTYTCTARATNAGGPSNPSPPSNAVVPRTTPGVPTGVTTTPAIGQVTVSSTVPTDTGGSPIVGYLITPYRGASVMLARSFARDADDGRDAGVDERHRVHVQGAGEERRRSGSDVARVERGRAANGSRRADRRDRVAGQRARAWVRIAPTTNGGAAITGYTIVPYLGTAAQAAIPFSSTATTQTITATNAATYTFKVIAKNVAGSGLPRVASAAIRSEPGARQPCRRWRRRARPS